MKLNSKLCPFTFFSPSIYKYILTLFFPSIRFVATISFFSPYSWPLNVCVHIPNQWLGYSSSFFFIQKTKKRNWSKQFLAMIKALPSHVQAQALHTNTKKHQHEKLNQDCDVRDQCQSMNIRISKHCLCDFQPLLCIVWEYGIRPVSVSLASNSNWFALLCFCSVHLIIITSQTSLTLSSGGGIFLFFCIQLQSGKANWKQSKRNTAQHNSNNNSNNNYNCAATFHNNLVFSPHVSPVFHLIESKRMKNCMQFHFNFNLDIYQPNGCARNQIHTHMHSISTLLKAHPLFPSVLHWMYECRLQSK